MYFKKYIGFACLIYFYHKIFFENKNEFVFHREEAFVNDKIDLVYFLSPSLVSQALNNIPYIFTLWDLGHLEELEFPECI